MSENKTRTEGKWLRRCVMRTHFDWVGGMPENKSISTQQAGPILLKPGHVYYDNSNRQFRPFVCSSTPKGGGIYCDVTYLDGSGDNKHIPTCLGYKPTRSINYRLLATSVNEYIRIKVDGRLAEERSYPGS
jgi:hypothetical protein